MCHRHSGDSNGNTPLENMFLLTICQELYLPCCQGKIAELIKIFLTEYLLQPDVSDCRHVGTWAVPTPESNRCPTTAWLEIDVFVHMCSVLVISSVRQPAHCRGGGDDDDGALLPLPHLRPRRRLRQPPRALQELRLSQERLPHSLLVYPAGEILSAGEAG